MNQESEKQSSESERLEQEMQVNTSHVRQALQGLRYGTVTVVVQDGVVVQVERTEKRRVRAPKSSLE